MASQPKNIEKMKIHLNSFIGGQAVDYKYGITNSFYSSQCLDFRSKPSQMSVLPGAQNLSSTMNDLVTSMVQDPNGVRYGVGSKGYIYRVSTSDVISPIGQLTSNGAAGIVYNQQSDQLYIPGQQDVSLYGQVQSSPQFRQGNFGASASVASAVIFIFNTSSNSYDGNTDNNTNLTTQRNNLSTLTSTGVTPSNYAGQVTNTLTNVYGVPNVINESSNNGCGFVPDIEPMYSIAVYVTTVGTGNWTLTVHDSLNNNLGTATISHANMVVGWNNFVFASPGIRAIPNPVANGTSQGYHFHLTSSVASDTAAVATIAGNNLSGCNMVYFAYRLVQTNNGWHPATIFAGASNPRLCIGNGPYLSTYNFAYDSNPNNTMWVRHQLQLDWGYEVCGLSINNQYLVIAAEKRSNNSSRNYQDGKLYFWDGINAGPNFSIDIPMGAPYSIYTLNNVTYFYCAGSLFAWGGGQQVVKIRYMAYQNTDYLGTTDNTIVNPSMMDARYNLLMLGYPSLTTNSNINYGVYSWGATEMTFPNSFGYSYSLSNQLQNNTGGNNLQIGMIKNFVDEMYMSWQYTDSSSVTHYGLDAMNNFSTPAQSFNWQSLIWDGGVRYKTKRALRYKISFETFPAGATLTAQYSVDRGNWISADPSTGVAYSALAGTTSLVVEMNNLRFHELQWGFTGTTTSATTPVVITGVTMEIDPLTDEIDVRPDTVSS